MGGLRSLMPVTATIALVAALSFAGMPPLLGFIGKPLINSVADMLKGHINMGIARFVMASLLTLATCLGYAVTRNIIIYDKLFYEKDEVDDNILL